MKSGRMMNRSLAKLIALVVLVFFLILTTLTVIVECGGFKFIDWKVLTRQVLLQLSDQAGQLLQLRA